MPTKKVTTDDKTLALIKKVKEAKAEIAAAERSNWRTNCSFPLRENSAETVSLHVESDVRKLILIAGSLMEMRSSYLTATVHLAVDAPSFTWGGFSADDWLTDIKHRINTSNP